MIRRISIIRRFMPLIDRRLANDVRDELNERRMWYLAPIRRPATPSIEPFFLRVGVSDTFSSCSGR